MKQFSNKSFFILLALFCFAILIRLFGVNELDIGVDESFSVYIAQLNPSQIITYLSTGDNPPLWELILHYWINLFGVSELSVRIPSLLFNVLTIIPIYLIGEKYISKFSGLFASLFYIFSNLSIFIAHESRIYSLLAFLTTLSVYFFLKSLTTKSKFLISLTITNIFILYSHYLGYWVLFLQAILYIIILFKDTSRLKLFGTHLLVILVCFLPQLPILYQRFLDSGIKGTWISKSTGPDAFYNMLWKFSNVPVLTVIIIVLLSIAFIKFIYLKKGEKYKTYILLFTWIPLIISFCLSFKIGFFIEKYFYFTAPLFYLSICIAINYLTLNLDKIKYSILAILAVLFLVTFNISTKDSRISGYHKNIKQIANQIDLQTDNSTSFIIAPAWFEKQIIYYLNPSLFKSYFLEYDNESVFKKPLAVENIHFINSYSEYSIPNTSTIIYIDKDYYEGPNSIIDRIKSASYILTEIKEVEGVKFISFEKY